jgi:hypothetical protein
MGKEITNNVSENQVKIGNEYFVPIEFAQKLEEEIKLLKKELAFNEPIYNVSYGRKEDWSEE